MKHPKYLSRKLDNLSIKLNFFLKKFYYVIFKEMIWPTVTKTPFSSLPQRKFNFYFKSLKTFSFFFIWHSRTFRIIWYIMYQNEVKTLCWWASVRCFVECLFSNVPKNKKKKGDESYSNLDRNYYSGKVLNCKLEIQKEK